MSDTLLLYAAQNYKVSGATSEEFLDDLNKLNLVARNIAKYHNGSVVTLRLILNQIVTLSNVFGVAATSMMLFKKVPEIQHGLLFPLLIYLGYMDEDLLVENKVEFDRELIDILRKEE